MPELYETTEDGLQVFFSEIHQALAEYIESRNIKDMATESQNKWTAALIYIGSAVFSSPSKLKRRPYDGNNLSNGGLSNNNAYDIDLINDICDIYIALCYEYDKSISLSSFCKMVKIKKSYIYAWAGNDGYANGLQVTDAGRDLHKKLTEEREDSLRQFLETGKRNAVSILGVLNREFGWNTGQPQEQKQIGNAQQSALDIAVRHQIGEVVELPEPPKFD